MPQCPNCQSENPDESVFCRQCGQRLTIAEASPPPAFAWSTLREKISSGGLLAFGLLILLLAWLGAGGISFGVTELTGGGPQGERGPAGSQGLQGPAAQSDFGTDLAVRRLASLMAVEFVVLDNPGEGIRGSDPRVQACLNYILEGTGSFVECGFQRVGNP